MDSSVQVVWLKRDLRVSDHAPLYAAAAAGPVLMLYMVEPAYWGLPDSAPRHWAFIRESLIDLEAHLRARGHGGIWLGIGEATDILSELYRHYGHFSLWSHEETGNGWTYARDKAVAHWARDHKVPWIEFPANGVVRRLKSRDEWADRREQVMRSPVLAAPIALHPAPSPDTTHRSPDRADLRPLPATRSDWEQLEVTLFGHTAGAALQPGGRTSGLSVLDSFLTKRASGYLQTLSRPGVSARHCSRLSPHIAFGTLSVREIVQATLKRSLEAEIAGRPSPDARNLSAFASRLAWRCHFVQKLEQAPAIETRCMHPAFEGLRPPGDPDARLEAWIQGQTGYPLIDACMRSLAENGWLTFRMRAMVVSFASYHLWLDWRVTAPPLARLFTDYEPGIHYAQMQMQSGVTGINTLRIYNPVKQSRDNDPDGRFIRRFVPELAGGPDAFIHTPWLWPDAPGAYPRPIVDHDTAVRTARAAISACRAVPDFREQARSVHAHLGSRKRPPIRRKPAQAIPLKAQLDLPF